MTWAWICLAGALLGGVAAFLGLRHAWRELDQHAAEHQQVLDRHEQHIER